MSDAVLREIRDLIQEDVNRRGLATDPEANLVNACPEDFAAACRNIAETPNPSLCVVTGFCITHAEPPAAETDGPLGAIFLARELHPLGVGVALATDGFCGPALQAGLNACGLADGVPLFSLPAPGSPLRPDHATRLPVMADYTHLIALERVGPSHTLESLRTQPGYTRQAEDLFRIFMPAASRDVPHSMRGRDLSAHTAPMHMWFEIAARRSLPTIGIGDGGNEIGMGKIPWDVIRRNVPNGGLIACRVPTDHLIVAGVSNWGAYALAAGVLLLRGAKPDPSLFDVDRERELLRIMVEKGPLVDGVTGKPTVSVDGLPFEEYARPLRRLKNLLGW
jgi:hypothetical protein